MFAYRCFSDVNVQFNIAYLLKFQLKTLTPHSFGLLAFTGPGPNTTAGCLDVVSPPEQCFRCMSWQVSRDTHTSNFYSHLSSGLSFRYSLAFQVNSFVSNSSIVCEITLQVGVAVSRDSSVVSSTKSAGVTYPLTSKSI